MDPRNFHYDEWKAEISGGISTELDTDSTRTILHPVNIPPGVCGFRIKNATNSTQITIKILQLFKWMESLRVSIEVTEFFAEDKKKCSCHFLPQILRKKKIDMALISEQMARSCAHTLRGAKLLSHTAVVGRYPQNRQHYWWTRYTHVKLSEWIHVTIEIFSCLTMKKKDLTYK